MVVESIVAIGLLTRKDVEALGPAFSRIWPIEEAPCFVELLSAIDDADREIKALRPGKLLLMSKPRQ